MRSCWEGKGREGNGRERKGREGKRAGKSQLMERKWTKAIDQNRAGDPVERGCEKTRQRGSDGSVGATGSIARGFAARTQAPALPRLLKLPTAAAAHSHPHGGHCTSRVTRSRKKKWLLPSSRLPFYCQCLPCRNNKKPAGKGVWKV